MITILQKGFVGLSPQPILGLDFDIDIDDLDVVQYHELLELEEVELEEDGVDEIIVHNEQADEEIDTGHPEDLGYKPAEEKPLPKEEIEQLALLQKISGERIPVPLPFIVAQRVIEWSSWFLRIRSQRLLNRQTRSQSSRSLRVEPQLIGEEYLNAFNKRPL